MNYSKIIDQLYVGTTPKPNDYDLLRSLGISLVINMRFGYPPLRDLHTPPMKNLWLPAIDSPIFPIPMRMFEAGVTQALQVINQSGVVYAHCAHGRHRGPAMGACILIALGWSAEQAIQLIKQQRPISDPEAWYIKRRILKFAALWQRG